MSSTILSQRAIQRLNPLYRLVRAWSLTGGVSAQVTALEIETGQGQMKMILRQHGERDLKANPHIARDEFALLSYLHSAGLPVPQPYGVDDSGEVFATPYILMEFIEGQTDFHPPSLTDYVQQCAEHLAHIHRVSIQRLAFLPLYRDRAHTLIAQRPAKLDESLNEGTIRDVLESAWPFAQGNETVLLHGDVWPGNLLWSAGHLVGIIDWEDAALGDSVIDLANARLEMLWAFGLEAMDMFTQRYLAQHPIEISMLPYWDLYTALRPMFRLSEWADSPDAEVRMRERHRLFVAQALQALG